MNTAHLAVACQLLKHFANLVVFRLFLDLRNWSVIRFLGFIALLDALLDRFGCERDDLILELISNGLPGLRSHPRGEPLALPSEEIIQGRVVCDVLTRPPVPGIAYLCCSSLLRLCTDWFRLATGILCCALFHGTEPAGCLKRSLFVDGPLPINFF